MTQGRTYSVVCLQANAKLAITNLLTEPLVEESVMDLLQTGCRRMDELLGGGLRLHQINLVYGEAGTGKTILSIHCVVEAARMGCKVFYVDSDQSFSTNRIEQLHDGNEVAGRIVLFRPDDFERQGKIVESIESHMTRTPTLLVVDSINGLYRSGHNGSGQYFVRDRDLNRQIAQLHSLCNRFVLWVLLTGQVHSSPAGRDWIIEPVAERTLRHWSDLILRLVQTPRSDVRDCFLEKKNGVEVAGIHSPFRITQTGIEDA